MLLDTNAYSALVRAKPSIVSVIDGANEVVMCVPVIAELRVGFELGNKQADNERKLLLFLSQLRVLTPDIATSKIYAELFAYARRAGRTLSNNDTWIAALAKQHSIRLVTYDNDFKIFEDVLEDQLILLED